MLKMAAPWLRRLPAAQLWQALRRASLGPVRGSLGFRFSDPSKSGSWAASNLKGYRHRTVSKARHICRIAWHDYVEELQLTSGVEGIGLKRRLRTRTVEAEVQRRLRPSRGEPAGRVVITSFTRRKLAEDKRRRIPTQTQLHRLLPAVIIRPLAPVAVTQWTLIYLHGMGHPAVGNYGSHPHFFLDGSIALKVVLPTAPMREVSCFDNWWTKVKPRINSLQSGQKPRWRLKRFFSWYDYISNSDGLKEDAIDLDSLLVVRKILHGIIRREAAELGGRSHRVILGGKSQGCCTALDAALTFPERLGGFIGVVGHLLGCTAVEPQGPQCATPLHFFHEPDDAIMRWPWVSAAEQRLRSAGYNVHSRRCADPEGHGHFIGGVEGRWVRSALRRICSRSRSSRAGDLET